jgi:hypothetical protein
MMKLDIDFASVEEKEALKAARGAEDIYLWKDRGGAVIRVFTLKAPPAVLFELVNGNAVGSFVFNTPGDFGDFVAVMMTLEKDVFGLDFAKILNKEEPLGYIDDAGAWQPLDFRELLSKERK